MGRRFPSTLIVNGWREASSILIRLFSEVSMPEAVVECIPNFSEARRPEVVEAIIQVIRSVPEAHLLDRHSDLDHNRTVLTFLGPPEAVEEAAFRAIAKAAELIDLDKHQGEHPRIGATDVVPFVPIRGISMQECVEIARRLGRRVGEELSIPVYLYEEAASRPERQNLENIRRGQYEVLKEEIATRPERAPDFGPARLGPAGATVIGARHPLIAFNAYLTTDDVSIAKKIAKAVRFSSGGLRYVKALGLLVEGLAQVSMNLTNYRETPVARVVEMIRREAQRYGVGVHHTELVGLIPQDALQDAAVWCLQLDGFEAEQVLERRLAQASPQSPQGSTSVRPNTGWLIAASGENRAKPGDEHPGSPPMAGVGDAGGAQIGGAGFLDALAAGTPTPGGGSAAAFTGAMGAALEAMIARLTIGKKKYVPVEGQMQSLLEEAETLRLELAHAVQKDADAFDAVMAAYRLPQGTLEEQQARLQAVVEATLQAADEPLVVSQHAVRVMELASQAARLGNQNAITDAATGFILARASLSAAGLNVRVNLHSLKEAKSPPDLERLARMEGELIALEKRAGELEEEIDLALRERAGLQLKAEG